MSKIVTKTGTKTGTKITPVARTRYTFNPKRDKGVVIHGLAPDLNKLISEHVIPDTSAEVIFNQLEDVKAVGCRVNDDFDAIMLARKLKASGLAPNTGMGSSQPAGSKTGPVSSSNGSTTSSSSE